MLLRTRTLNRQNITRTKVTIRIHLVTYLLKHSHTLKKVKRRLYKFLVRPTKISVLSDWCAPQKYVLSDWCTTSLHQFKQLEVAQKCAPCLITQPHRTVPISTLIERADIFHLLANTSIVSDFSKRKKPSKSPQLSIQPGKKRNPRKNHPNCSQ